MLWAFFGAFPVVLCSWRVAHRHPPARDTVAPVQRPFAVARMSLAWLSFPKRSAPGNWDSSELVRDRSLVEPNSDSPCGEMPAAPKPAGIKEARRHKEDGGRRGPRPRCPHCSRPVANRENLGFGKHPCSPGTGAARPPAQQVLPRRAWQAGRQREGRGAGWGLPGAPASLPGRATLPSSAAPPRPRAFPFPFSERFLSRQGKTGSWKTTNSVGTRR